MPKQKSQQITILSTFFTKGNIAKTFLSFLILPLLALSLFNLNSLQTEAQSQQSDFTLADRIVLIPFENITFSPERSTAEIYGEDDLTISVNTAGSDFNYIQEGATCLIQVKIQDAVNKNGTWTDQWTSLYDGAYSQQTGCSGTLPANNQVAPWFSVRVKITNPTTGIYGGMVFGSELDYAFLYGAIGIVEIIGEEV